jgi:hypothetical protein
MQSRSRDAFLFASEFCSPQRSFVLPPNKMGGGAPLGASNGIRYAQTATRNLRKRPALRRSTAALRQGLTRLGSGPRFLETPDPNGRTHSGTSAASTSRSDHAPDGTMPEAARQCSVWPRRREPHPLRLKEYPREGALCERDLTHLT